MKEPSLTSIIVILLMAFQVNANIFCSAYCDTCVDIGPSNCSTCPANFTTLGLSCNIDTTRYTSVLETQNSSSSFSDSKTTSSCSPFSSIPGIYSNTDNPSMSLCTLSNVVPHYLLRIRLFFLWIDTWGAASTAFLSIDGTTQTTVTYPTAIIGSNECQQTSQAEGSSVFDTGEFTHITSTLQLNISTSGCPTDPCEWAVKELIVLAVPCHSYCSACTGPANTQCSACVNPYLLTDTTCDTTCPSTYYQNSTSTCEQCNINCTVCSGNANTCSVCKSGFLLYMTTCVSNCPDGTYVNGLQCSGCPAGCATCTGNPIPCQQCQANFYLQGSACPSSCSTGTFANSATWTCDSCDGACTECSGSTTNCSACIASSVLFVSNNSCLSSCPDGWYEDTILNKCLQCDSSCSICANNPSPCTACNTSFFLSGTTCGSTCPVSEFGNTATKTCDACDGACTECSGSSTNCSACVSSSVLFASNFTCLTSCPNGWWEDTTQNKCIQCDTSCTICTNTPSPCTACNTSFFLSGTACGSTCPTGSFANSATWTCDACDGACTECSGSLTNCLACVSSSVLFASNFTCLTSCPNGWWEDTTQNKCIQCDTSCTICTNTPSPCTACNTSFFLSGTACGSTCPTGSFANSATWTCDACDGACTECSGSLTNCSACVSSSVLFISNYSCLPNCPDGWWQSTALNQCFICDNPCLLCAGTSTVCSSCKTGFFLSGTTCQSSCPTGTFENTISNICDSCDVTCTDCNGTGTNCSGCVASSVLFLSNFSCISNCPGGWFENVVSNQCFQCDGSCALCTGTPIPCTSCNSGFFLSGTACINPCPDGKFANIVTRTCDSCDLVCTKCTDSANNCSACISTHYLMASTFTCLPACPATLYYAQTTPNECIHCDIGCSVCAGPSSNCSVCLTSYYYHAAGNLCTLSCPALTTPITGWICLDCDSTCLVCTTTATNCSQCVSAYVLFQSNYSCISSCPIGYFENSSNICEKCHASCESCTGIPIPCSSCSLSFFLHNSECVTTCPDGTYPNVTARNCDPCHSNCSICTTSTTVCTKCATGFYLYIPGLSCASDCPGGYYTDSSTGTGICLTYFCSSYCTPRNCTGIGRNQCKMECPWAYSPAVPSTGVCNLDTGRYQILMQAGNETLNSNSSSLATCGQYVNLPGFFGPSQSVIIFNDTIFQNHFKIRVRAAIIFIDEWAGGSKVYIRIDGSDVASVQYSNILTMQQQCNEATPERGWPVDVQANHDADTAFVTLRSSTCANSSNCLWIYREAVVAIISCHSFCSKCWGTNAGSCSACNNLTSGNYLRSNNTCALACHAEAFQTGPNSCTFCAWNCTRCAGSPSNCSVCRNNSGYVYLADNNTCPTSCPPKYFNDTNICRACDALCESCSGVPSPCQTCVAGAFFHNNYCYATCPVPLYDDLYTMTCLTFQQYYVFLTMELYFVQGDVLNINMVFSQPVDFTTFDYQTFQNYTFSTYPKIKQGNFQFKYTVLNSSAYEISLKIKDFTFLSNELLTFTTNNSDIQYQSIYGRPFYKDNYEKSVSTHWSYIKVTNMSESEQSIASTMALVSIDINDVTSGQYVQDVKKSGVVMLIANSLQITSCMLLVNTVMPRNLYEGIRIFASFIFFDVPAYQAESTKSKFFVIPNINDLTAQATSRRLLAMSQTNFRRSGFTSYFLFDAYPQVFIICLLWILLIPAFIYRKTRYGQRIYGYLHSLLHKFNDIAILYFTLTLLFQFYYFTESPIRITSLILCIICNLYLFIYGLYRYYDLMSYPYVEISDPQYERFALLYGGFLKNIRYVKYRPRRPREWLWDWKQPSSYHIISYIKKVLMMFALAIFYSKPEWQVGTLIAIQLGEIARFWIVWPFKSRFTNIVRFALQFVLLCLFCCMAAISGSLNQILSNPIELAGPYVESFFLIGWVALGCVLVYNTSFLLFFIYEFIQGCRFTNRELMDATRREYYESLLHKYEKGNQQVPTNLLKEWNKKGLLDQKKQKQRPVAMVVCESYEITIDEDCFVVYIDKVLDFVKKENFRFVNSSVFVEPGKTIQHQRKVDRSDELYPFMLKIVEKYAQDDTIKILFKTLVEVDQAQGKPGDKVPIKENTAIEHDIQIQGQIKDRNLNVMQGLEGFPIPTSLFIKLYCM